MRVGIAPFIGGSNPYQQLTAEALRNNGVSARFFPRRRAFTLSRAAREVDLLHIDWLHVFYESPTAVKEAIKRALFKGDLKLMGHKPVVWNVHNLITHDRDREFDTALEQFFPKIKVAISFTRAGIPMIRDNWPALKETRIEYVPHGHYANYYPNTINRVEARDQLELLPDQRVGLFLGRISPYKGLDQLITAFRQEATSKDVLFIAGEPTSPEAAEELQELAEGDMRIRFIFQSIPDEQLQVYFNAADYAVFPFRRIFNSGSVILALSFGLPIVAPDVPTLRETVEPSAFFSWSSEGEDDGLASALRAVFGEQDLSARGVRACECLLDRHSWERITNKLISIYESIL